MKSKHLKLLCIAHGEMDALLKKNYLVSKGIEPILYEESLGTLYGLISTPLGEVEIYVRNEDFETAKNALDEIR